MYSKKYIDIITLALIIIIFILINIYQFQIQSNIEKLLNQTQNTQEILNQDSKEQDTNNIIVEQAPIVEELPTVEETPVVEEVPMAKVVSVEETEVVYPADWYVMIPSIDLVAPVRQGTTTEILSKSVGHFEESPVLKGNVCLAAHNRGYEMNFFEKIKNLLLNDIIVYQYGDIQKSYAVSNITIIKETDWSYIEGSNENKITLITCVENEPEYRLCVQAIEIK